MKVWSTLIKVFLNYGVKNTHECPKCGTHDVIRIAATKLNNRIVLDAWGMASAGLDRYICYQCGFTEEWIQIDKKFDKWVSKNQVMLKKDDGFV